MPTKSARKGEEKARHCATCGRFLRLNGHCVKVFYDDYAGAWEHE